MDKILNALIITPMFLFGAFMSSNTQPMSVTKNGYKIVKTMEERVSRRNKNTFKTKFVKNYEVVIKCDQVLHKYAADICYSYKKKEPILVAYDLNGSLVNKNLFKRKGLRFKPDYSIPAKYRSYSKDYSRTGKDRGHNQQNAAFDYNRTIQKQTFLMSNICPQAPKLNRMLWAKIEKFARSQSVKYGSVEVFNGTCGNIGNVKNSVVIPKWWYKILILPNGKTIAFLAENINSVGKDKMKQHIVSISTIERTCNIKFIKKAN